MVMILCGGCSLWSIEPQHSLEICIWSWIVCQTVSSWHFGYDIYSSGYILSTLLFYPFYPFALFYSFFYSLLQTVHPAVVIPAAKYLSTISVQFPYQSIK